MKKRLFGLQLALAATIFTMSTSTFAQLGSTDKDLVYTPVTPCRVLDTRTSQGGTGAIAASGTKHFKIWGQTSFAAQGGSATNCGLTVGSNIAAVAMNFTVVTPAAGGFITAYPFGGALPVAATVNFQVGDIARGDFTIAKVTQTGTDHLSIFSTSLADVVGDVVGYYSRPVATGLECVFVSSVMTAIAAGGTANAFSPACTAGYSYTATECRAGTYDVFYAVHENGLCAAKNTGAATTIIARSRCCRIPGR